MFTLINFITRLFHDNRDLWIGLVIGAALVLFLQKKVWRMIVQHFFLRPRNLTYAACGALICNDETDKKYCPECANIFQQITIAKGCCPRCGFKPAFCKHCGR